MHEYETFVYLDVQKTGSSFIASLLRRYCRENKIGGEPHVGLPEGFDRGKFHFISVRDPLDQYLSLYSFGCQQMDGQLYQRLEKRGYADYYDATWRGFRAWLDLILDPENAPLLGWGYGVPRGGLSEHLGYQSFRVLDLAVPQLAHALGGCKTRAEIVERYKKHSVVDFTVRYESFREDLATLVSTRLRDRFPDLEGALAYIASERPHNASDRVDRYEDNPKLGKKLKTRLEQREWLLYAEFGYSPEGVLAD